MLSSFAAVRTLLPKTRRSGWRLRKGVYNGRWWNYVLYRKVLSDNWHSPSPQELTDHSTEFADPLPPSQEPSTSSSPITDVQCAQSLAPADKTLSTLVEWAVLILNTPDPDLKVP
jgi:hypothetical protein